MALAIVEGDETVHLRGFGEARPGGEEPTPQTPYIIGSLTKSFTALAVMQLVEDGKLWRYYSLGTAKPPSHPGPSDRWRRYHA